MPAAVRNIELSRPLTDLDGLHAYQRCMLALRWRGRIVGRVFVPVSDGRVGASEMAEAVRNAATVQTLYSWLEDAVGYDGRVVPDAAPLTASVVICTRERPEDLRRALTAVARSTHQGHDVIVIDNAPTSDATRRVVEQFASVRYVREPRRGLNAARNRALREASGDIVAFTDDDAVVEPEWLDALLANFRDARVQCATGLTLPLELETEAQELFEEHCPFARGFRRRIFDGQLDNPFAVGPVGAGANMAVRRDVGARLGPFDERLDAGTPTRSGGDHEMFARILSAGYHIAYDPAAVSWHRHRRTRDELFDTVFGYGVGVYAMWTGMLLEKRELGVLRLAWGWFRHQQLPTLIRSRAGRGGDRTALARAELRGCLHGPRAWLASRRASTPAT